EVIDFDILTFVFVLSSEDLTGEPFLESFFPAFRLESLGTAAGRLRIRAEIFSAWTIARFCAGGGICKVSRATHRRPGWAWSGTWTKTTCGPRPGFSRPCFVYGQGPSFERLVVELADCRLCMFGISEFDKREPTFFPGFAIQRNRNVGQITDRRKVIT